MPLVWKQGPSCSRSRKLLKADRHICTCGKALVAPPAIERHLSPHATHWSHHACRLLCWLRAHLHHSATHATHLSAHHACGLWCWLWSHKHQVAHTWWAHCWHHVVWHKIVWSALSFLLSFLLLLFLPVQGIDSPGVLSHALDEVWHAVIHHALTPSQLQYHVWAQQVVAREEACSKAILHVSVDEKTQQGLCQVLVATVTGCLHCITEHLVSLGKLNGLLVPLVLLVHQGRDAAQLHEFILLQLLRQLDLIEVVKILNGGSQLVKLLAFQVNLVQGLVDGGNVVSLHLLEVWNNQSQVA
mmetsp:Transcript_25954/g.60006  ORF Transcript_25954/g.60006 Transcript_25954/m.60006 type:complete len:300 (+) Transcript_25954:8-907(+)